MSGISITCNKQNPNRHITKGAIEMLLELVLSTLTEPFSSTTMEGKRADATSRELVQQGFLSERTAAPGSTSSQWDFLPNEQTRKHHCIYEKMLQIKRRELPWTIRRSSPICSKFLQFLRFMKWFLLFNLLSIPPPHFLIIGLIQWTQVWEGDPG